MNNTGFVSAILHLTCFGIFYSSRDVRCNGADLRVWHQTARAENLTQRTNDTHRVGRSNHHVKRHIAGLDGFRQIFHADDISTRCLRFFCLRTSGEYGHPHRFTGTGWQHDRPTNHLVRFFSINAELYGNVDRFVKFCSRQFLHERNSVIERIGFDAINFGLDQLGTFSQLSHYRPSTVMPMERAEPAIVRTAASRSAAVRSGCFWVAISSACLRVILPTLSVCGLADPF